MNLVKINFLKIFSVIGLTMQLLLAQENSAEFKPSAFFGNGYSLTNNIGSAFTGQIGFTKYFSKKEEGNYRFQIISPRMVYGYNFNPIISINFLVDYDLLLVRNDIDNFHLSRNELLLTPCLSGHFGKQNFFCGLHIGWNNRVFLYQTVKGVKSEINEILLDVQSKMPHIMGTQKIPYEKYLIYLSVDAVTGIKINRFKPYLDYRFTLHKYGYYHQMSAGTNVSFYHNHITVLVADIIKFYQPDIKNYLHVSIGYSWFRNKKD